MRFEVRSLKSTIKYLILFLFITLATPFFVWSQQDTSVQKVNFNKKYVASYWHDTKKIVTSPARWRAAEWSAFAGVIGASVATYFYDDEIFDFFERNGTETTDAISKYVIGPWGNGMYSIPLLGIIYITGRKNNHHKNVALTGLKAFLLSGGAAVLVKHLTHRHRPSDDDLPDPYLWEGPYPFTLDNTSFPSGHTTTAFAIASVLARGYKDKIWIGITSYSVATLVGLSRLHDGEHWATDVIAGAALGTAIGLTLSSINFSAKDNIDLGPTAFRGGYGIRFAYKLD